MALGGDLGAALELRGSKLRFDVALFSETNGRWLAEASRGHEREFLDLMAGTPATEVGRVGGPEFVIGQRAERVRVSLSKLRRAWTDALPNLVVVS